MPNPSLEQTPEGWGAVVSTYEKAFEPFTCQFVEEALQIARVTPGQRLLDVATGAGACALAAARSGAAVTAIDFSAKMVDRVRQRINAERLENASAMVMDGQALTFPDESFDHVFCAFGVMFFPDRARGLSEIYRVLKPPGRAVVIVWASPFRVTQFFKEAMQRTVPHIAPPQTPAGIVALQDGDNLNSEMRSAGFQSTTLHTVSRTWTTPSAEWLWDHATGIAPVMTQVFDKMDPATKDIVRAMFIAIVRDEFREGIVRIERKAHIAIGIK